MGTVSVAIQLIVISELGRQEGHEFEVSLGYTARPCLKNKNNQPKAAILIRKCYRNTNFSEILE
jgi:hypothetical protein